MTGEWFPIAECCWLISSVAVQQLVSIDVIKARLMDTETKISGGSSTSRAKTKSNRADTTKSKLKPIPAGT